MAYVTPKIWKPGDPYTPADFNTFVKNNMEALACRSGSHILELPGGVNVTTTSTSFEELPTGSGDANFVAFNVPAPSNVFLHFALRVRNSTSGNFTYFDIKWLEKDVFISSMQPTPASGGLWGFETRTGATDQTASGFFIVENVPEGVHTFQVYWRTNANTSTVEKLNSPFFISGWVL